VIHSFLLATVAIVLAEMGDKTQLLAMAFAARFRWHTVLWAVCAATLVNHLMAVVVGNVVTQVLPLAWIKLAAAASFVIFALWTIRGDSLDEVTHWGGRGPFWTVAIAFFIAEMGDKTQLMTIALAADEAVRIGGVGWTAKARQIVPVWMGTTCGMLIADAFGIVVGIGLHKHIPETAIKWIAALCFAGFGLLGLHEALDLLLPHDVTLHHAALIAASLAVPALMWFIARQSAERRSRSSAPEAADATDESRE
jgi:putative Ca2+/H+ antiporter (TMEM165/GDT1 family)